MPHDPALAAEAAALKTELDRYRTLQQLRSTDAGRALEARARRPLAAVRRTTPATPPGERDDHAVRAVHWNIEHGNWYEQVEAALLGNPDLADADLYLFNEVDLGMARAANRDVTANLAGALNRYSVWAPQFLETTPGRDDDPLMAAGGANAEALFGISILSRWPIGEVRVLDLPSPEPVLFDLERMIGRFVALIAVIERPGAPFVAVSAHLEVHRTRRHRADQIDAVMRALRDERRPVVIAGDFNTHTFDRGLWHAPFSGGISLLTWPGAWLRERLTRPDRGLFHEPLFDVLRAHGFTWDAFVDYAPTLALRFDRLDEVNTLPGFLRRAAAPVLRWAEARGALRLDWFAGRGWKGGRGRTVHGVDGRGKASDHAPIVAEFE